MTAADFEWLVVDRAARLPLPHIPVGEDTMTLRPLTAFTDLATQLNALGDRGAALDIDEVHEQVRNHTLFAWLPDATAKADATLDLSAYDDEVRDRMHDFFERLDNAYGPGKHGIATDGLRLLLALCIEGARQSADGEWP